MSAEGDPASESGHAPRQLSDGQRAQLEVLLALLESDEHAPTAIRSREQAAQRHVADSLAALAVEPLLSAHTIADLGSGAGFPGLAVAVALPAAEVALVESRRRTCEFLERARAAAGVRNARVVCARVEQWREGETHNDAVLARALAEQPVVLEYAAPLLRVGGILIDWRGAREADEEAAADRAAELLGMRRVEVRHVVPFAGATNRHLHVFTKVSAAPDRFPRRAGIALKRPLGR